MLCPKHDQSGVFPDYRLAMTGMISTNNLHTSLRRLRKFATIMVQIATMINTGNDMQQLKDDHRNNLLIFPVNKNRRKRDH
jgi:hypothetical protein